MGIFRVGFDLYNFSVKYRPLILPPLMTSISWLFREKILPRLHKDHQFKKVDLFNQGIIFFILCTLGHYKSFFLNLAFTYMVVEPFLYPSKNEKKESARKIIEKLRKDKEKLERDNIHIKNKLIKLDGIENNRSTVEITKLFVNQFLTINDKLEKTQENNKILNHKITKLKNANNGIVKQIKNKTKEHEKTIKNNNTSYEKEIKRLTKELKQQTKQTKNSNITCLYLSDNLQKYIEECEEYKALLFERLIDSKVQSEHIAYLIQKNTELQRQINYLEHQIKTKEQTL